MSLSYKNFNTLEELKSLPKGVIGRKETSGKFYVFIEELEQVMQVFPEADELVEYVEEVKGEIDAGQASESVEPQSEEAHTILETSKEDTDSVVETEMLSEPEEVEEGLVAEAIEEVVEELETNEEENQLTDLELVEYHLECALSALARLKEQQK